MSLAASLILAAAPAAFALPTGDGQVIFGQIDPASGPARAMVVLVPGFGGHTRDYKTARGPDGYRWYRDLASRLTARSLSVARYDTRGKSCEDPAVKPDPRGLCENRAAAATITPETNQDDIMTVVTQAGRRPEARCLVVIGHSEGNYHLARLIEDGQLRPQGYIVLAGGFTSWVENGTYQRVNMLVDSIRQADANGDGVTTEAELSANIARTPAAGRLLPDGTLQGDRPVPGVGGRLETPRGGWTASSLRALRARLMQGWLQLRDEWFAIPPDTSSMVNGYVMGTQGGRNRLNQDMVPIAWRLRAYRGALSVHMAGQDALVDVPSSLRALERLGPQQAQVTVHPGLDHVFRSPGTSGPASETVLQSIVDEAAAMAAACAA